MARELKIPESERTLLVRSLAEAYEELRVLPGIDANGPALVWLADQFLQVARSGQGAGVGEAAQRGPRGTEAGAAPAH